MTVVVTREQEDAFVITLDDGKANVVSPALLDELGAALDRAEKSEKRVVVLTGREGMLSGGFDLKVLGSGGAAAQELVTAGAELLMRLYLLPKPVVTACPGHAIAMGAFLLLASDFRLGAQGTYRIGLSEVAIGMTLPVFGVVFARERLSKRYFEQAALQARMFSPDQARDAGFLDRLVEADALEGAALEEATRLAALHPRAFAATKGRAHAAAVGEIRETLAADMAQIGAALG